MIEKNKIFEYITNLLKDKFHVPDDILISENFSQPLTGYIFNLTGTELVILLFEIEKEYDIKIKEDDLINYQFSTINNISETIKNLSLIHISCLTLSLRKAHFRKLMMQSALSEKTCLLYTSRCV